MDTELYLNNLAALLKLPGEKLDARERRELGNIAECWPYDSRVEQIAKLSKLFPARSNDVVFRAYDVYEPACLIHPTIVTSVLELTFHGSSEKALRKVFPNIPVSVLSLRSDDLLVPPADLIILPLSLHHMTPEQRAKLFSVFREQAKFSAVSLVIQEYDYQGSVLQYALVDTVSNYDHSRGGKFPLPFHPLSAQQLEKELWQAGIALVKRSYAKGEDRVYWALYQSSDHLLDHALLSIPGSAWLLSMRRKERYALLMQERGKISRRWRDFSQQDTILPPDAPELEYWQGTGKSVETPVVKWGQLKLFAATLQILTLWDWETVSDPTVVYAGAAEGWNVEILADMFPSVTWHLYDWREFNIAPHKKIHIHSGKETGGDFNDEVAKSYAKIADQMLFLSDIRSSSVAEFVLQDMLDQARWVRIMRPRMSALKFHPPFPVAGESDDFPYLPGQILLQPFNGKASDETRLIIQGDEDLDDVIYSKKRYESQLFYHNMIIRSTPYYKNVTGGIEVSAIATSDHVFNELAGSGYVVDDDRQLDNHWDSIYFLHALLRYIQMSKSASTPLLLAREIIKRLNDQRAHPFIFSAERESGQREYKDGATTSEEPANRGVPAGTPTKSARVDTRKHRGGRR